MLLCKLRANQSSGILGTNRQLLVHHIHFHYQNVVSFEHAVSSFFLHNTLLMVRCCWLTFIYRSCFHLSVL